MHNKHRGEISARLDGRDYRLCLSLGALAELEAAFGEDDMIALACRFESGRLKAGDAISIIGAGLRGGGADISDEAVAAMRADDGAAGYMSIVVRLLEATFGGAETTEPMIKSSTQSSVRSDALQEVGTPDPFLGTT